MLTLSNVFVLNQMCLQINANKVIFVAFITSARLVFERDGSESGFPPEKARSRHKSAKMK
jgi:hypothetical protein